MHSPASLWWRPHATQKRALLLEALDCFRQAGDIHACIPVLWPLAVLEIDDGRLEAARALYEEAIAAGEEAAVPLALSVCWGCLGWVLFLQGELEDAALLSRKSLITCRRLGTHGRAGLAISVLACCATGAGDYRLAAELTGVYDVLDARSGVDVPGGTYKWFLSTPLEQKVRDDNRARLRQVLGEADFERFCAVGKGLSFHEAADLALGRADLS